MAKVSFEEIESLKARLREINAVPFAEIEWTTGGWTIAVPPAVADHWRFIGLNNSDFAELYDVETKDLRTVER